MARNRSGVVRAVVAGLLALSLGACGDDDDGGETVAGKGGQSDKAGSSSKAGSGAADAAQGPPVSDDLDPQRPPTDAAQMKAWLDRGFYKDWVCEREPNTKTEGAAATHVHGDATRVCTNVLLAASVRSGEGELAQGVASVKEVYDSDDALMATLVAVKTDHASDEGEGWYWYASEVEEGQGYAECTGCHAAAGADDDHPGLGDFVYFQNRDAAQLPAIGTVDDMQEWLDEGHYEDWHCEVQATPKDDGAPAIHAHAAMNRVCTNDALFDGMKEDDEWPAGVASVKEIYNGATLANFAVSVKVATKSEGGQGWYWSEGPGVADFGDSTCTGCHAASGSDADHPGAGDYVYFLNE